MTNSRSQGFTLMEMLLAITLFVLVMSSSYGIFTMGIQIWKRMKGDPAIERQAVLAMERMGSDIRSTLKISQRTDIKLGDEGPEFEGDSTGFSLPAIVTFPADKGELPTQTGQVSYEWKSGEKILCRALKGASHIYEKQDPPCKTVAEKVVRAQFRYWMYDGIGEGFSWYDSWDVKEGLPQAIQATLEFETGLKLEQTFLLPVGGKSVQKPAT